MAYIVNSTDTTSTANASFTPTLGTHQTNDLLLVFLTQDSGATAFSTATSGWTILVQARSGTTVRHAVAYKVAASGSETAPTFSGATEEWLGTAVVVRDADATNPFGASPASGTDYLATAYTSANNHASGTITTATNGALIFYSYGRDGPGSASRLRGLLNSTRCVSRQTDINNANVLQTVAYVQQQSAGSTSGFNHTVYGNGSAACEGIVIAVRNASGGALQPDIRPSINELRWYGDVGVVKDGATSWSALSGLAASIGTIGGNAINCSSVAPTTATTGGTQDLRANWSRFDNLASSQNASLAESSSGVGIWVGGYHSLAPIDLTNSEVGFTIYKNNASSNNEVGSEGSLVIFGDGTNWVAYQIQTKSVGWVPSSPYTYFLSVGVATPYASSGTIDLSAVTQFGLATHRTSSTTASATLGVANLTVFSASVPLTGGGANRPAKFSDYQSALCSWNFWLAADLQGGGQTLIKQSVQIGDGGTNTTYFSNEAGSLEYPPPFSLTPSGYSGFNTAENACSLTINAGASDVVLLASGAAAANVPQQLTIDSSSSTSATYSFAQSFVGWNPTFKTGINVSSAAFSMCGEIDAKGSDWTDCTIAKTTSTDAAFAFSEDGGTLTRCTIDVTGTSAAYHLELGTAVTAVTLTDVTFTGTPTTDKVHVKATTGTVTITISGTTTLTAGDITSDGATVDLVAPTVTLTVSNLIAGSTIKAFTTGTQTEVWSVSSSGTSEVWADAGGAIDLTVIKEGYLPVYRETGIVFSGVSQSRQMQQIVDRAFQPL